MESRLVAMGSKKKNQREKKWKNTAEWIWYWFYFGVMKIFLN